MTAENVNRLDGQPARPGASMRPRPMTAENAGPRDSGRLRLEASMRPRPMTAENEAGKRHTMAFEELQ